MGTLIFGSTMPLLWAVPVLLLAVLWIRTPIFVSAGGKRVLLWLKFAILGLLVLAMLDPRIELTTVKERSRQVFAIDVSASVDGPAQEAALLQIASHCRNLPKEVEGQVICFDGRRTVFAGDDPALREMKTRAQAAAFLKKLAKEPATDLGGALESLILAIPPGKRGRAILLSDGQDTHGGVSRALERLVETNLAVDVYAIPARKPEARPRVVRLILPEQAFAGEEVKAQALLFMPEADEVELTITGSDGISERRLQRLEAGYSPVEFAFRTNRIGVQAYGLTARAGRQKAGEPVSGLIRVRSLPRVLVFESSEEQGRFLRNALTAEKIDFLSAAPGSWPADLPNLVRRFPCVILNNIPKAAFQPGDLIALRESTREGNGLMMIGGPQSFGQGDYTDSPVEEALPVRMPRRTINQPLALVLLLDCSGSMSGMGWSYLVEAAKEVIRLCKGHFLGLVLFSSDPTWVFPLQQITQPEQFCDMLDDYSPGGGTIYYLPLAEAFLALRGTAFSQKSVLMMSDGEPGDPFAFRGMFEAFRGEKITVSTIGAGYNVNFYLLEMIARETGGQFYNTPEFRDLPNLFRKEFKRISGPPTIEERFKPTLVNPGPVARGISPEEVPSLDGLTITQAKPNAEVIMLSPRGDPVIARWRFGLGRGIAFATDLLPRWSRDWARWDGTGKILRQAVKDLSEGARESAAISVTQRGMELHVTVDPGLDRDQDFGSIEVPWTRSHTQRRSLQTMSDGRLEATLIASAPGVFPLRLLNSRGLYASQNDAFLPVNQSREYQPGKTNLPLLRHIAEKTGGEWLETLDGLATVVAAGGAGAVLFVSLWPWIAILALLLYIFDIFLRKSDRFGISPSAQKAGQTEETQEDIYRQLGQKFLNMAEEHSLRGDADEAKRFYLRAKAFFMKAQATKEAQQVWERYKRFEVHG